VRFERKANLLRYSHIDGELGKTRRQRVIRQAARQAACCACSSSADNLRTEFDGSTTETLVGRGKRPRFLQLHWFATTRKQSAASFGADYFRAAFVAPIALSEQRAGLGVMDCRWFFLCILHDAGGLGRHSAKRVPSNPLLLYLLLPLNSLHL
jgi:hypothetical protein